MMAKFIEDGDKILDQVSDFEVQIINNENGEIVGSDWHDGATFNNIFDNLESRYEKELEISVLDYGDEFRAIVTPSDEMFNHHYAVLMTE